MEKKNPPFYREETLSRTRLRKEARVLERTGRTTSEGEEVIEWRRLPSNTSLFKVSSLAV